MAVEIMTAVWKLELPSTEKFVLLCLADNASDEERVYGQCFPSIDRITQKTGLKRRTVFDALGRLEASGYIDRKRRWNDSTVYQLTGKCFISSAGAFPALHSGPGASAAPLDVHQPHPNRHGTVSKRKEANASQSRFDEFWQHFPKQRAGKKDKAKTVWLRIITEGTDPQEIIQGVIAYAASDEVARGYAKGAAAWLNDDRWTVNYRQAPGKPQTTDKGIPVLEGRDAQVML